MLTVIVKGIKVLLSVLLTVSNIFAPITGSRLAPIERDKADCKASFAVVSDTHLKDNFIRKGMFELGLADMDKAKDALDAMIIDGDITDYGYPEMWECVADSLSKYNVARQTILVEGNHDARGPEKDNYDLAKQLFIEYNKKISDRELSEVYYSTTIGEYPAIILGSESDNTSAYISDIQIEWFASEMEKASETGLPIFVFLHQPINGTHGLPYTWELNKNDTPDRGGIGDQSDAILEIIQKYKNVFYVSGHIHSGFSVKEAFRAKFTSIEQHDGYTLINLPSFMYPDFIRGGFLPNGTGYVFEVYENEVMIRARNFATGRWISKYDITVPIA